MTAPPLPLLATEITRILSHEGHEGREEIRGRASWPW